MEQKIQLLEISMAELKKDLSFIKDSLSDNKAEHKEIIDKMDTFINSCDKKYAPYSLYEIFIWSVRIVAGALILGVLALIGRVYLHLY